MAKKDLSIPTSALDGANARARQTAKRVIEEQAKTGKRKPSEYFMRIDLVPNGVDLKGYVIERARQESAKQGRTISATRYVQELIEADMKAHTGKKDKRKEISDMLNGLNDKDLATIETVIKAFLK